MLAPRPHICRCVVPHVADMACCSWLSTLAQWSVFNWLAARECAESGMVKLCHALWGVWDVALHCHLNPRPHICRCVAPHVADMACCSWLSTLAQWSVFNWLAARECAESGMVKLCHALCGVWDVALHCHLNTPPHVCRCASRHVVDMACCSWLSTLVQWSIFNWLAARECALVCMAKDLSCFVLVLGLGFALLACCTSTYLPLRCTTCG